MTGFKIFWNNSERKKSIEKSQRIKRLILKGFKNVIDEAASRLGDAISEQDGSKMAAKKEVMA